MIGPLQMTNEIISDIKVIFASGKATYGSRATDIRPCGVGFYVALAIQKQNLVAIGYAIPTMVLIIVAYDELLLLANFTAAKSERGALRSVESAV
jgi:ABC-type anion transport system duplicated permease subunit